MPDLGASSHVDGRQHRNTVNTVERKPALSFHALAKEDVGSETIEPSDIASFVNVVLEADLSLSHSRDNIATALYEKTNPEVNHKGARIVWVEHAKTGELVPVILRGGMTVTEDSDDSPEDHKKESDNPNTPLLMPPSLSGKEGDLEGGHAFSTHLQTINQSTHAYTDTIALLRFAFLFVQGILAGFSFTTINSQTSTGTDLDFLISYQPNAMEYRRLFYLFTSISVTGSIDTLMTLISKVLQRQGADENMEDSDIKGFMGPLCTALTVKGDSTVYVAVIIALLHGIAFLSTIIMSQVDIFIAIRGGASLSISPSVWAPVLLSSPGFKSQLNSWQSLGQVRVVCSVLAWAGACYLSYKSVTAVDSKITEISRLREALFEWRKRVGELEGNEGLEALSLTALKRLVALQQIGLDRAQNALSSLNSRRKASS